MRSLYAITLVFLLQCGLLNAASLSDLTYVNHGSYIEITDCDTAASGALVIPDTIEGLSVTTLGLSVFYQCSELTSISLPVSITTINYATFSFCTSLTTVNLPDGITTVPADTFSECHSLTSITIPQSVTAIEDYAFSGCKSLTSITIPDNVTSIGWAVFSYCESLASITIPANVSFIDDYAFRACDNLANIHVAPENQYFSSSDGILFNKNQTTIIRMPEPFTGAYTIPATVNTIEPAAFWDCIGLTDIVIPGSVTTIEENAFYGCSALQAAHLPDGITTVTPNAFGGCSSLTRVTFPDSVTTIEFSAFSDCSSLRSVTIPASVTTIKSGAFSSCSNLKKAIFEGNGSLILEIAAPWLPNSGPFSGAHADFSTYYYPGAAGFTTPTWNNYPCEPLPYALWAQAYGLPVDNTGNGALNATPANDDIPNLLKYALGMVPTTPYSPADLPQTTVSGSNLLFTYQLDTAKHDLTYTVQTSTNLTDWTDNTTYADTALNTNGTVETHQITIPLSSGEQIFTRLKVE